MLATGQDGGLPLRGDGGGAPEGAGACGSPPRGQNHFFFAKKEMVLDSKEKMGCEFAADFLNAGACKTGRTGPLASASGG